MRATISCALLFASFFTVHGHATEKLPANSKASTFSLPAADSEPAALKFSDVQMGFVQSWIKQKVPECPADLTGAVAQQFLEELQQRYPDKLDQLTSGNFSTKDFESILLRDVAAKLTGVAHTQAREEMARRRIVAVLTAAGTPPPKDIAALMEKIRDGSQSQYRRLVEGRMDDDDLQLLLKKISQGDVAKKDPVPDKPKVLTAADIVAEFSRRNQTGSSLQKLQAYVVECRIKTANDEQQELLLFRMRPDKFRLVVRVAGATRYILAGNGGHFWQQRPNQSPQAVSGQALGQRRYLAEYIDPLLAGEGFTFERLEDGVADGKKYYRVSVRREDASKYVAHIDMENFREIGRENEDGSVAQYGDFREIGGVIYAFRETLSDQAGQKGEVLLTRVTPNPGLIQDIFEPPARTDLGYFELEGYLAPTAMAAMKFN